MPKDSNGARTRPTKYLAQLSVIDVLAMVSVGRSTRIRITSNPSGATVFKNPQRLIGYADSNEWVAIATTPCVVKLWGWENIEHLALALPSGQREGVELRNDITFCGRLFQVGGGGVCMLYGVAQNWQVALGGLAVFFSAAIFGREYTPEAVHVVFPCPQPTNTTVMIPP